MLRTLRLTLVLAALFLTGCRTASSPAARSWMSHVEYLAADSLAGRNTGTPGYLSAARYVAGEFRAAGAIPGGSGATATSARGASLESYFQPVSFVSRTVRESECSVALVRNGETQALALGEDANLSMGIESADSLEAPMVFVGWGISLPEEGYDDLAGLDLRGRIVVYLRGGPDTIRGPLRAHAQTTEVRWARMRAAGAVGQVSISDSKTSDIPWARATLRRLEPSLSLDDPLLDSAKGMMVSLRVNPEHAEPFFAGSGHTYAEVLALADSGKQLPRFPLVESLRARVRFAKEETASPNVVAILKGHDPALANQYVVLSAHLDHLGTGGAVNGDSIYNGAMDNASGVASLIEIAKLAADSAGGFRRSIVLLALTGEEQGLEGSRYFAAHPTVPPGSIVANINLDMFLPIVPLRFLTVYGLDESDLGDWIRPVAERSGVRVLADAEPQRNLFTRSDQYNFIRAGVPALSFKIGYEKGSKEEALFKDWTKNRYHAPSDDLRQPIDREAAVAFTRLLFEFAKDVANRDETPRWKPDSFFRRFAVRADSALAKAGPAAAAP